MPLREGPRPVSEYYLTSDMEVGTPVPAVLRFPVPASGRLKRISAVKDEAFTGAAVITYATARGTGTTTLTLPTAGAANDVVSVDIPNDEANADVEAGDFITLTSDGGPTDTPRVDFTLSIQP